MHDNKYYTLYFNQKPVPMFLFLSRFSFSLSQFTIISPGSNFSLWGLTTMSCIVSNFIKSLISGWSIFSFTFCPLPLPFLFCFGWNHNFHPHYTSAKNSPLVFVLQFWLFFVGKNYVYVVEWTTEAKMRKDRIDEIEWLHSHQEIHKISLFQSHLLGWANPSWSGKHLTNLIMVESQNKIIWYI